MRRPTAPSASRLSALVLDGNSRAALVAARQIARTGRPVGVLESLGERRPVTFASRWPRFRGDLPDRADGGSRFVDALVGVLERHPADVLIAVSDGTVSALRSRRAEIDSRTRVALASEEALVVAVDKRKTLAAAVSLGIAVPRGTLVEDPRQVSEAAEHIGFPAVVKPAASWAPQSERVGRLECEVTLSRRELEDRVRAVLGAGAPVIVQQWVPGSREAVHMFFSDGEVVAAVGVVAHRTYPALGGNSVLRETIPLPADIAHSAERLVRHLDLQGYAEVEFRRDPQGRPLLMEINPRLSASVEVAVRAGVDFPNLLYDWATGRPLHPAREYRPGVRLRWLGGDLRWLRQAALARGGPDVPPVREAMVTFGRDFLRRTSFDYLDPRDPGPAAVAVAGMVSEVAGRRLRRGRKGDIG